MRRLFIFILLIININYCYGDESSIKNKLVNFLSNIDNLEANFVQSYHDGSIAKGKLYLKRPDKILFIYNQPNQLKIVINGDKIIYHDLEIDEIGKAQHESILPKIIFSDFSKLIKDKYTSITQDENSVYLKIHNDEGYITFVTNKEINKLNKISISDSINKSITLNLSNYKTNMLLPEKIFSIKRQFLKKK